MLGGPSIGQETPLLFLLLSVSCLLILGQWLYHYHRAKRWQKALGTAAARSAEMNILLAAIADNSTDVIIAKDVAGRYQIFNHAAEQLFSMTADKVIGKRDEELFPQDLAIQFISSDKRVLASGHSITYEEDVFFGNKVISFLTTKSPMLTKQGALYGVCGIATDITTRKSTEAKLMESERKFSAFFFGSPVSKFILDLSTSKFSAVNGTLCSFIGHQIEDVVGKSFEELNLLADPAEVQNVKSAIRDLRRLKGLELNIRRRDGSVCAVACFAEVVTVNKTNYLMGSFIDISEQKRFEEELVASRMRYLSLFEHMLAAVAYCQVQTQEDGTEDLVVLETNPHFEQVSGLNPLYVTERPLKEVMPDLYRTNPEIFERCATAANTGISSRFETWVPSLSRWLQFSVCGLGKGFFVMLFDDITERKRNETEVLRLNEKLNIQVTSQKKQLSDAVGDMETFVYSVSTLLQDSLTSMISKLKPMNVPSGQPAQVAPETARHLMETATKMERLLEGAVSYLCGTALPFEPEFIDMANVINPVLDDIKSRYPDVIFDLHEMPRVIGSAVILRTIYSVLLDNAARFSLQGKKPPLVTIGASRLDMETVFSVEDTGPGIIEDRMSLLFTPFSHMDIPQSGSGVGVGLALARRMVERHGGRIWALPNPKGGCVFQFTLGPLEIEHHAPPQVALEEV